MAKVLQGGFVDAGAGGTPGLRRIGFRVPGPGPGLTPNPRTALRGCRFGARWTGMRSARDRPR